MSTIIVAAILIAGTISICLILVSINNKDRKKTTAELLNRFSKLGTENDLSFSSQEILGNCVIGLDGMQRKFLVLKKIDTDKYASLLIDLSEVKSCSKKKIYRNVNIGTGKKEKFENHIDKIVLDFDFIDNSRSVQISFFEPIVDPPLTMPELEQKAKNWETILSKIINPGLKKIA
jgi:hypothetical protein